MSDPLFEGRTILIADDEEYVRQHISKRLVSMGLHVLQAGTGEEVLGLMSMKPDLIIMDVRMPVLDGLETLKRLGNEGLGISIPVVLLSAMAQHDKIATGIAAGAVEYIIKPITFDRLLESIHRYLGQGKTETSRSVV